MRFEVKRRFLLGFLVLATLFLACSLFVTGKRSTLFSLNFVYIFSLTLYHYFSLCSGENIEKLIHAIDAEELSEFVTIKQRKGSSSALRPNP
jgi:hypothetical protein